MGLQWFLEMPKQTIRPPANADQTLVVLGAEAGKPGLEDCAYGQVIEKCDKRTQDRVSHLDT
jgi:hypothetical protein